MCSSRRHGLSALKKLQCSQTLWAKVGEILTQAVLAWEADLLILWVSGDVTFFLRVGVTLCSLNWPGTCYIDQFGFNSQIFLPSMSAGIKGVHHYSWPSLSAL